MPGNIQRCLVVAVVLLTVSATIFTPVGGTPTGDSTATDSATEMSSPSVDEPSALERKRAALTTIETLDIGWRSQGWHRKRAVGQLNSSLSRYRDENRVDSAIVFREDRRAIRHVRSLRWADAAAAEDATELIVSADLATVNTSIEDARRALDVTEERAGGSRAYRRAQRFVRRAVAARDRALDASRGDRWRNGRSFDESRSVAHLERAWRHAQRALDELERASHPTVTINTRSDPARNGSEVLTRAIRGTVSAVRAYELGNVTVAVDGEEVTSVALNASTAPATNASFAAAVDLERPVNTVTVRVADGDDRDRRFLGNNRRWGRWSGFVGSGWMADRDWRWWDRGRSNREWSRGRIVSDTVRFDGDGLPDVYELDVVESDPSDPDSDVPDTAANEADDGVLDGGEDFDDDGLITYAEYDRGTDPFVADTDADGLGDRFEAAQLGLLDTTNPDTDADGIPDGKEDFDGDGLAAVDELANGTSVASRDTDRDGLGDLKEIQGGTNASNPDTDDDGLEDASESNLETDPLDPDTDGDGVLDGNETFTATTTDSETNVSVDVTGTGDAAFEVSVEGVNATPGGVGGLAPVVRLRNGTAFENATLSVPVEAAGNSTTSDDVTAISWDPANDRPWHPVDTAVDATNRTVRATVESPAYVTVVNETEWSRSTVGSIPADWPNRDDFGDLDDWSAEGEVVTKNGSVNVVGGTGVDAAIVVAADGSGDFERIQPAVDSAPSRATILVREGTYREQVLLNRSLTLRGVNATLDGAEIDGFASGFQIVGGSTVAISGFAIEHYGVGVLGARSIQPQSGISTDVELSDTAVSANDVGIVAPRSTGGWGLDDVSVASSSAFGIGATGSTGDWRLSNVTVTGSGFGAGIAATDAHGNWTVTETVLMENAGPGVDATGTTGDWALRNVSATGNDASGVDARESVGNWTLGGVAVVENGGDGLTGEESTGDFDVERFQGNRNGGAGLYGYGVAGRWRIENARLVENEGAGVSFFEADGPASIESLVSSNNGREGIDVGGVTSTISIETARVSENGLDGLGADDVVGVVSASNGSFVRNDGFGVSGFGTTGTIRLANSSIHENGVGGIDGRNAASSIAATGNWWGRTAGPAPDQVLGEVQSSPYCTSSACHSLHTSVPSIDEVGWLPSPVADPHLEPSPTNGGTGTSVLRRQFQLPSDASDLSISVRVRGRGTKESQTMIRVVDDAREVVVSRLVSARDSYQTESADLTGLAGASVVVEAIASEDSELSIDWIDVAVDTDGDGLRDLVESTDLGLLVGPRPGATLASLDPGNPDSDGDGIPDGEELTTVELQPQTAGSTERGSLRAVAAESDPTSQNSDGGGLTDRREREIGSDPLVLETLVVGYTIPTMTEGPGDTIDDRNPMTVGEANGLQAGGGPDSDLIAWPSRQYFDPLFCIKELTGGPGCAPSWIQGVDLDDDSHYVYVPFVVYAESDTEIGEVPYEISFSSPRFGAVARSVGATGKVSPGQSKKGFVVYELPDRSVGEEFHKIAFRSLGEVKITIDLAETIFGRDRTASVGRGYTVSTSTTLPRTEQMLEDTQFVLEQGINVAFAVEAGYSVAVETGSRARGAFAFLYHLAKSQISTPPKTTEDYAEKVGQRGIAAFQEKVRETSGEIEKDVFGDGVVRAVGPAIIRQN